MQHGADTRSAYRKMTVGIVEQPPGGPSKRWKNNVNVCLALMKPAGNRL
jgi:hypothetical protein